MLGANRTLLYTNAPRYTTIMDAFFIFAENIFNFMDEKYFILMLTFNLLFYTSLN